MKIPRLWKVHNQSTGESFTVFAITKDAAVASLPIGVFDEFTIDEVRVTTEDGCSHPINRLKDIPVDSHFRTVNANSFKIAKTTMIKDINSFDPSETRYYCVGTHKISSCREFKPSQYVIIDSTV